jgi:broad specificity phosphatase PhoE
MRHIYLVRHGTTEYMEAHRVQGSTDSPLSPRGRQEASLTAAALQSVDFQAIFCSPLGRTRETADIICSSRKIPLQILNDLREMDFGCMEGASNVHSEYDMNPLEKMHARFLFLLMQLCGESLKSVTRRARSSWETIDASCPDGTLLVVAHGVIINCLFAVLSSENKRKNFKSVYLKPCSISEILLEEGKDPAFLRVNDADHIQA